MSELSSIQIPKPSDEQAFERCNVVLWRCVLNDHSAEIYGRRGQRQYGVDIVGRRNGVADQIVGIQCKLRGADQRLTEKEVREEVRKALTFEPPLSEYFIVTTAPDDAKLQSLALELSQEVSNGREKELQISVLGWDSLQRRINRHVEARRAFDPSHTAMGDRIQEAIARTPNDTATQVSAALEPELKDIGKKLEALQTIDPLATATAVHSEHEQQINDYVSLIKSDPSLAIVLLERLEGRLGNNTSGRIRFRVAANIAACHQQLGNLELAANGFVEAWKLAPKEPKAIANKAYGLLLREDWSALRSFAEEQLPVQQDNAVLAACYVSGLVVDESVNDPLGLIPPPVRDSVEVVEAYIRWLMKRGEVGDWWDAANCAHADHSNNEVIEELYATALLERIQHGSAIRNDRVLDQSEFADASIACGILASKWGGMVEGGRYIRSDESIVPFNLMVGYRLLGKRSDAIEVGTAAMERFPEDQSIREVLGVIFAKGGEHDRALELFSGLDVSGRTAGVRLGIACATGDWSTVRVLADKHLSLFRESERDFVCAAGLRAKAELAPSEQRLGLFKASSNRFRQDTRGLTLLAEGARLHGFDEVADAYFAAAQEALSSGDDGLKARTAIASEALARQQPNIVVNVLIDELPTDRASPELYLLAQALVSDRPIRARALDFFQKLDGEVRSHPAYAELQGILHFNRGSPEEAIEPFSEVFEFDSSIDNLMRLVGSHIVCGSREAVDELLKRDGVDDLPGSPLARMNYSHVLLDFGEGERALEVGYRALIDGFEHDVVVMMFMGLILKPSDSRPTDHDDLVTQGTWTRLTSSGGEDYEALVGESESRPWGDKADPENSFVARALGLRVGDEFDHTNATTGMSQTWTVAAVKPGWLQAFHHITAKFGQLFPDVQGFASMRVTADDIDPVLSQVRRAGEHTRNRADLYKEKQLPLAAVAGKETTAQLAFTRYLVSIGEDFRVCQGTDEERSQAIDLIRKNTRSGAVLDALTVWRAAGLGVLDVLEEQLGPLAIPANEFQQLNAMLMEQEALGGKESMRLGYKDGEYVRDVLTEEDTSEYAASIRSRFDVIKKAVDVQPVVVPDGLSELGEKLMDSPLDEAVGPAVLAGGDRLLVCEDMTMRNLVGAAFGAKGVWIQAVLLSALRAGKMSLEAYAEGIVYLAYHRHGYVTLESRVLLSVFERDTSDELWQFEAVCKYVGNEHAEVRSHVRMAAEFINEIWNRYPRGESKVVKATSLVFRFLFCDYRGDKWVNWAALLCLQMNNAAIEYFEEWCRGQLLSFEDVLEIVKQFENQYGS